MHNYLKKLLQNIPTDWLQLTTHRLDIYKEELAKTEFTESFEKLYNQGSADTEALANLPTAYDYIRLGHPLSSVLEWAIAKQNKLQPEQVISFDSQTAPILAVLRKNLLDKKKTLLAYKDALPANFDAQIVKEVYGYHFELKQVAGAAELTSFEGSAIYVSAEAKPGEANAAKNIDFEVQLHGKLGSVILIRDGATESYVSAIQHVRRRETIAMTPANCHTALQRLVGEKAAAGTDSRAADKAKVEAEIKHITHTKSTPLVASSGLSMQYAIMMGLVHHAQQQHPGKDIRFLVPPNCYGGTNDQARRVAACLPNVAVADLPVDGQNDMVQSTERVLAEVAQADAVPYIIVEIPTNPRVEVPKLELFNNVLTKQRKTAEGKTAIAPVLIIDQTFCPNVDFLSEQAAFSSVQTLSYVSGSKFPSGGKCTAGYCATNTKAAHLLRKIEQHLQLADNEATDLQLQILAEQLPSMNQRIAAAYKNTRAFVGFIEQILPEAKINFVSDELAEQGFTPSVFSLDLPTKGTTEQQREQHKRQLNQRLIDRMIGEMPNENKYCVSYGQLKGCYWTIPATSTQGTTKEADKDYIARVSLSPNLDLTRLKEVFADFVEEEIRERVIS